MSFHGRNAVWDVVEDRGWHPVDDVRRCYPEWYWGLVHLVQWGWQFRLDKGRTRIRLLPAMPLHEPDARSLRVLEHLRDLPALPKLDEDDEEDLDGDVPQTLGGDDEEQDEQTVGDVDDVRGDADADDQVEVDGETDEEAFECESLIPKDVGVEMDEKIERSDQALAPDDVERGGGAGELPDDLAGDDAEDDGVGIEDAAGAPAPAAGEEVKPGIVLDAGTLKLDQSQVTETCGILAVKGSGKSYTAMVIAEEMLEHGLPFCALDPTGAWWGLRAGADGDPSRGYPLLVAGGDHGDVEIGEHDGATIARYLVDRYPTQLLCDLSLMTPDEQHQFGYDFAHTLYFFNRRALHVFVDEVDELCPQRPQDSLEQKCLGVFDRLVRRGRIRGIGLTGITQRSAVWSKNMLSQVGSLVVLKTGSPQDLKAIEGWVSKILSSDEVKKFLASLGGLKKGEAWYVSPGSKPLARRVQIRRRHTFDSSRTPAFGEDVRDPTLRAVDASDLKLFLESGRHQQAELRREDEGEGD